MRCLRIRRFCRRACVRGAVIPGCGNDSASLAGGVRIGREGSVPICPVSAGAVDGN